MTIKPKEQFRKVHKSVKSVAIVIALTEAPKMEPMP